MPVDPQATACVTVVDRWIADGARHAVIAPGSRSTPLAVALAERRELAVHVVHDERSAAYIALGIGLQTGVPAVLLCTSGTAATHFHGAVVEADLSGVPMLVCTADRPAELRGIGSPQTIDQRRLYGSAVRDYLDPGVPGDDPAFDWSALADRAWLAAIGTAPGPVQLNLAFREPLVGTPGPPSRAGLPPWRSASPDVLASLPELADGRGLIVAGRGVDDPLAVGMLAAARGWPVFADPRSGCRTLAQAVCAFDALLRAEELATELRPEIVVHLGEPPASKVLGQWLTGLAAEQLLVHAQPRTIDPLGVIDQRIVGWPGEACTRWAAPGQPAAGQPAGDRWLAAWLAAEAAAQQAFALRLGAEEVLSEPGVARTLTDAGLDRLVVSSSMPVRDVEWFGTPSDTPVLANRGANGIDGVLATAVGAGLAGGGRSAVLLGDVALCHDASSLTALARRGVDLTIVVVDNDGGGIFSFLPQATSLDEQRFEQLFGTPHGTDLITLARAHGIPATTVTSTAELRAALGRQGTTLVRVASDRAANVALHGELNGAVRVALRGG